MKVVDIANEIYLENASPTDTTIPAIAFWIRSSVGQLNTKLYEKFYIDPTTKDIYRNNCDNSITKDIYRNNCDNSIIWEIGKMGAAVIKLMYKVYRLDLDIRNMLVAVTTDTVLKAADQEFQIEKVNKSELLKTLAQLKKDTLKELTDLVHNYRSYHGEPQQVSGDDTIMGHYTGITSQYTRNVIGGGGDYSNGTVYDEYEET